MVLEARPVEKREVGDDKERVKEFSNEMLEKWWKGRREFGTEVKIDPLEEAMDECLDIANYAMEQYFRIKFLREKVSTLVQRNSKGGKK